MWARTAICAAVFALSGCGGDSGGKASELELELREQSASGQSGTATFTELEGGKTRVVMEVSNSPSEPQPAHVHPGPCDDLGPPVAALTSIVEGKSETVVPMSLEALRTGELVVHAHKSQQDYKTSVVCAEIPGAGQ